MMIPVTENPFRKLWLQASEHPLLRRLLDATGVKIVPFYLFLERLSFVDLSHLDADFDAYDTGFLHEKDMGTIAAIPGRKQSREELLCRLSAGHICFGMKNRGDIAAFTWCEPGKCSARMFRLPIKEHEAYLYDAYTLPGHRGKGIAPYLRFRLYRELAKRGFFNFYSYSLYFSTSAVRFKEKLNARRLGLGVYVEAFYRWHLSFLLKRYRPSAAA